MKEKVIRELNSEQYRESDRSERSPVVLLLAGAAISMLYWDSEFYGKLAGNGFFAVQYDSRDVGKSTCYGPGIISYDLVDLTYDTISIQIGYSADRAHFVGMKSGGLISQMASVKFPDTVASLTLVSTRPWGDSDPGLLAFHCRSETVN